MIALGEPLLVVGLVVLEVEGMPALLRNLEWAHIRFAAVGFVARHDSHALVVDLQKLCVRQIEVLSRFVVSDVLLKSMSDEGQTARYGAGAVDDAHPVGVGFSV